MKGSINRSTNRNILILVSLLLGLSACDEGLRSEESRVPEPNQTPIVPKPAIAVLTLPNGTELALETGSTAMHIHQLLESENKQTKWIILDKVFFKTGSSQLVIKEAEQQLDALVTLLNAFPKSPVQLGGFAIEVTEENEQMSLSKNRAQATLNALIELGVNVSSVSMEGFGNKVPLDLKKTDNVIQGVALRLKP